MTPMPGMDCNEFVELVTEYLDGRLDPDTARRFVEHLAECDGCDRYLDQIRRTVRSLGHLPADGLDGQVRDRLLTAFRDWRRT
jgi:anti-sigma factor RsiW